MATITTILASDIIASSRVTLNTNFANLNTDKVDINSTYADPAWITSLAGSKITGNIGGNAATATALATARTIAGVSFNGTANIAIPSTGLSDSSDIVRGASSVASGQVLYGTGAGVAGTSAGITYSTGAGGSIVTLTGVSFGQLLNSVGDLFITNNAGAGGLIFRVQSVEGFRLATTTRNLLLGTTTDDGTNRLQVAGSVAVTGGSIGVKNGFGLIGTDNALGFVATAGQFEFRGTTGARLGTITSAGAFGVYNETPTTGATQLIVRAGAGQSTTNLTTWQNSGGTALATIGSTGRMFSPRFTTLVDSGWALQDDFDSSWPMLFASGRGIAWSSTTSFAGTKDLSLSRASANTLQVGDGGSNANGGLFASSIGVGVTPSIAANVNQVIIRAGSAQSTTNLTTWQNSSGTAQSRVNVNGGVESAVFLAVASSTSFTGYRLVLGTAQLEIGSAVGLNFSSSTEATATKDAGLARNAAGVVEINSGTAGTFRDLYLRGVRPVGSTVANLPTASGNTGMMATVTDATVTTIGTTVAGGGGNTVLVWSNGTNWRIYAN
jgi:hypothetical protein